MKHQK